MGAGLPVISTLKSLLDSGDEVQRIEGIFRWASRRPGLGAHAGAHAGLGAAELVSGQ